jgi:hypothetical protein
VLFFWGAMKVTVSVVKLNNALIINELRCKIMAGTGLGALPFFAIFVA